MGGIWFPSAPCQRFRFIPHDLDPNFASGQAQDTGTDETINFFPPLTGSITSFVFNPEGTAATAGNTTGGNNGLDLTNTYFSNIYPGIVFEPNTKAFTVGDSDVSSSDVTASFSNQAPLPSVAGQWWTMSLAFANDSFTSGKTLRFTVGHGPQHNSIVNTTAGIGPDGGATSTSFTQADLFGQELLLPDGTGIRTGMTFSGTTSGGGTFSGQVLNKTGHGYSKLDGFGFINAEAAAHAQLP